jgi:hypothetical protein
LNVIEIELFIKLNIRLRIQRSEMGLGGDPDSTKTPKVAAGTPTNPEDRKKILQRLRECELLSFWFLLLSYLAPNLPP